MDGMSGMCMDQSLAFQSLSHVGLRSVSPARISGRGPPFGVTGSMAERTVEAIIQMLE